MTRKRRLSSFVLMITILIAGVIGMYIYKIWTSKPSIQKYVFIYIYPSMNVQNLADTLYSKKVISNKFIFNLFAKELKLKTLKPGKYRITKNMTLPAIIRMFKNGQDEKVNVIIHGEIYYYEDFIRTLDTKLMISREDILKAMKEHPSIKNTEWMNVLFIHQYKVSWAISAKAILDSIYDHYKRVWTNQRRQLLQNTSLSPKEAMILASIVQHESYIYSEQRKIAGVYLNRLKRQMPLQADPTLKYANHKMHAQRLYNADKEINSPYNTYKHKGLPPTVIGPVSNKALDAVLNFEQHNYLYFCAKPDLNGYSNYSTTYDQHLKCARQYQQQLNQLNIK